MRFSKNELKEIPDSVSSANLLTVDDLLDDFAVTSENKVLFPIARVECEERNIGTDEIETVHKVIYTLKDLRDIKIWLDSVHRAMLSADNRCKYVKGKTSNNFKYYGWKLLEMNKNSLNDHKMQQKYLSENGYSQVLVSHTDCGYAFRGGDEELPYRDMIADYVCDGTNDTEILQQAIDSNPDENIEIMLLEDEYVVKPTSGSGTVEDPYICLNINRDNLILRSCDRKTNITIDRSIVKEGDVCYIIAVNGENVDISNIHFGLDELDIHYVEYKYPAPTEKMLEVKAYVESVSPEEKIFSKAEVLRLINKKEEN